MVQAILHTSLSEVDLEYLTIIFRVSGIEPGGISVFQAIGITGETAPMIVIDPFLPPNVSP